MSLRWRQVAVVAAALGVVAVTQPVNAKDKVHVGWVEEVMLHDVGMAIKAKMDTGATTSSIDADIIDIAKAPKTKRFRAGKKVVFTISVPEKKLKKTFERDVIRYVRIKQKGGGFVRRPVIEMTFCIGGKVVSEEVNLANRENFIYPVLVGRNMMQHAGIVVDPSRTFMSAPRCTLPKKD